MGVNTCKTHAVHSAPLRTRAEQAGAHMHYDCHVLVCRRLGLVQLCLPLPSAWSPSSHWHPSAVRAYNVIHLLLHPLHALPTAHAPPISARLHILLPTFLPNMCFYPLLYSSCPFLPFTSSISAHSYLLLPLIYPLHTLTTQYVVKPGS